MPQKPSDDPARRLWAILSSINRVAQSGESVAKVINAAVRAGSVLRSVGILYELFDAVDSGLHSLERTMSIDAYLS
ncbi:MAG: hypothetical protein QOG97_1241, partial [Acidimicrobiaceae bacterium]|nr:hypothetical protein [Acidimicrobiaceae bacterium]